jgi:hypothetical protein
VKVAAEVAITLARPSNNASNYHDKRLDGWLRLLSLRDEERVAKKMLLATRPSGVGTEWSCDPLKINPALVGCLTLSGLGVFWALFSRSSRVCVSRVLMPWGRGERIILRLNVH